MQKVQNNITLLKDKLPHGSLKEIAALSNTTIYTVSRVFNGKSNNLKVLKAIRVYVSEIQQGKMELEAFINHSENERIVA